MRPRIDGPSHYLVSSPLRKAREWRFLGLLNDLIPAKVSGDKSTIYSKKLHFLKQKWRVAQEPRAL